MRSMLGQPGWGTKVDGRYSRASAGKRLWMLDLEPLENASGPALPARPRRRCGVRPFGLSVRDSGQCTYETGGRDAG